MREQELEYIIDNANFRTESEYDERRGEFNVRVYLKDDLYMPSRDEYLPKGLCFARVSVSEDYVANEKEACCEAVEELRTSDISANERACLERELFNYDD